MTGDALKDSNSPTKRQVWWNPEINNKLRTSQATSHQNDSLEVMPTSLFISPKELLSWYCLSFQQAVGSCTETHSLKSIKKYWTFSNTVSNQRAPVPRPHSLWCEGNYIPPKPDTFLWGCLDPRVLAPCNFFLIVPDQARWSKAQSACRWAPKQCLTTEGCRRCRSAEGQRSFGCRESLFCLASTPGINLPWEETLPGANVEALYTVPNPLQLWPNPGLMDVSNHSVWHSSIHRIQLQCFNSLIRKHYSSNYCAPEQTSLCSKTVPLRKTPSSEQW